MKPIYHLFRLSRNHLTAQGRLLWRCAARQEIVRRHLHCRRLPSVHTDVGLDVEMHPLVPKPHRHSVDHSIFYFQYSDNKY